MTFPEGTEIHAGVEHGIRDGGSFFIGIHARDGIDGGIEDAVRDCSAKECRADDEEEGRAHTRAHGCKDEFRDGEDDTGDEEDEDGNAKHALWAEFI